jgi:uncharacterized protein (UPF0548 family)
MLSLKKPSIDSIRRQLAAQSALDFTYAAVGATNNTPPTGYLLDHTRIRLGVGEATFLAAQRALRNWQQFQLGWLAAAPTDTPIETGSTVAVLARVFGLWSLNCARIVYTIDDKQADIRRFGFAYGTLPDHVETGEERFLLEWDTSTDGVHYDILAFSSPRHLLAKLGYPFVRRMQKRFGCESAAAVQHYVKNNPRAELSATPYHQG